MAGAISVTIGLADICEALGEDNPVAQRLWKIVKPALADGSVLRSPKVIPELLEIRKALKDETVEAKTLSSIIRVIENNAKAMPQ